MSDLFEALFHAAPGAQPLFTQVSYLVAAALFILALKWLSAPGTARRGVIAGEVGMGLAIIGTILLPEIEVYHWIIVAILVGTVIGVPIALLMPMTAVPQRTALSHSFGGLAVGLVGAAKYYLWLGEPGKLPPFIMAVIALEVLLGFLTFTGSLMAFGKLQEILPTRPMVYKGQNIINFALFAIAIVAGIWLTANPRMSILFPLLIALALTFGVLLIIPIGGADMPTVISLLNSYAGLSACAMGFVLDNKLLIIAGALDGSSGFILSVIMCKAMNRSFTNVLFGAFGQVAEAVTGRKEERTVRSASPEEAAQILESASSVVIVPGYGMAVAQAQHRVRELYDLLTRRGVDVKFGIHPVAGRMPGHMNVLLAEADIPYDRLYEMEDINPELPQTDVALIIGANDVTNPAARSDQSSPIYGMPIIDVDKARTVMVIKRSMSAGFAGIQNELYYLDKTLMLFGDAKGFVGEMVKELGHAAPAALTPRPPLPKTGEGEKVLAKV
jgi:NAD(P) transhydrogenase subunit beta